MKVIICGPRDFYDYEVVCAAIEASGFDVTEVVSGDASGVDSLAIKWAKNNKKKLRIMPAKWKDLKVPGAIIKKNKWGQDYNHAAGFQRNQAMVDYVDPDGAVIAIVTGSQGTADTIRKAKVAGLKIFTYDPEDHLKDEDVDYVF